jgi:hypothetical protein
MPYAGNQHGVLTLPGGATLPLSYADPVFPQEETVTDSSTPTITLHYYQLSSQTSVNSSDNQIRLDITTTTTSGTKTSVLIQRYVGYGTWANRASLTYNQFVDVT